MTILTAGFVESEMTKGKAIQRDGEVAVDEEARDVSCNTASSSVSVKNTASPTSGIVIYGPPNCFTDEQINKNSSNWSAGADRGVPRGPCREAVRGGPERHPERRLVRDMAVAVPDAAADRLPRPRGLDLAVLRSVQRQEGEPAAEPEDAGRHRSQTVLPAVAPEPSRHQDGEDW